MKHFLILFTFFHVFVLSCQITDDFSDLELNNNPTWTGFINNYTINSSFQLQSNNSIAASTFLTTPHLLTDLDEKEWSFWIKQAFSPSSNNFTRVYLTATNSDLSINPDGYFLQFGETGSLDAIRLFKQENSVITEILAGNPGEIANSFALSVKVVRNSNGDWFLYADVAGGTNYILESTNNDASNLLGNYFGIKNTYTVSNANKFYFDNIYVGPKIVDVTPPEIVNSVIVNSSQLDVTFNEVLEQTSAENISNYNISPNNSISLVQLDASNQKIIHVLFANPFTNGSNYTLTVNNVSDLSSNITLNEQTNFSYYVNEVAEFGDVLINEIMADPSPIIGLPEVEYIEIMNVSTKYFDLSDWKLYDASGFGTIQHQWLSPGEIKILCTTSTISDYPTAIPVSSFPSFNNATDRVELRDPDGKIIDSLSYSDTWYQNETKKNGGYSLERIHLYKICSDENNWKASESQLGGTPEQVNSVFSNLPDTISPKIQLIETINDYEIKIYFSEFVDSSSIDKSQITVFPNELTIQSLTNTLIYPKSITIQFNESLKPSFWYEIEIQNVKDCFDNVSKSKAKFVLTEEAKVGDIVINEILYNPFSESSDFVELYNLSDKIINLKGYKLANIAHDSVSNKKEIEEKYILEPNGYVILTNDSLAISEHYEISTSKVIQQDLPNYNIDSSSVLFLNPQNQILDKVSYSDKWQFELVEDTKGKSLEKINPTIMVNDSLNWHTAAETAGFATPGRINSQYYNSESNGSFTITNNRISPDNDGFEDLIEINYNLSEPSMLGSLTIYDLNGNVVRKLLKNDLLSTSGNIYWDGITDENSKAQIGTYIVLFEAFNTNGKIQIHEKLGISVVGKL